MNILSERSRKLKIFFICGAIIIAGASLIYSHTLIRDLYAEEVSKMEVWAEAMRSLTVADETTDLNLVLKVINSNHTIPVIVTDSQDNVLAWRNLSNAPQGSDSLQILRSQLQRICQEGDSMKVEIPHDSLCVHYEESVLLHRLSLFPYVQLSIVFVFVVIAFMALMAFKRAEQNRVWVGLSRETAHQLGTPISSIMAWIEVLRETYPEDELLPEMANDVQRLQLIAERFSKIGSAPELTVQDLCPVVTRVANYMDRRTSKKVSITVVPPPHPLPVRINAPLFEWVIENLCRNAVDAMHGQGSITIRLSAVATGAHIEFTDTGKGIPRKHFKTVFRPGFTTKQRGWGLGLSLARRIISKYHSGRIYVKSSEPGVGTTFAIDLH